MGIANEHLPLAVALGARGYDVCNPTDEGVRRFLPWVFELPSVVRTRALGYLEGCAVELLAYDAEGGDGLSSEHLVAVVSEPTIQGDAVVFRRATSWQKVSFAKVLFDAIAWLPPFSLVKLGDAPRVDTKTATGNRDFDAHFRVAADDPAHGVSVVPPPLCEALVTLRFQGTIELREGAMLVMVDDAPPTPGGVARLAGALEVLVPAVRRRAVHPMR